MENMFVEGLEKSTAIPFRQEKPRNRYVMSTIVDVVYMRS